LLIKEKQIFNC